MKKYIIATYRNVDIWYARFDEELGYYVQDGLCWFGKNTHFGIEERDFDNTVLDLSVKIKEISKKDYYTYICMKISKPIKNEIKKI